MVPESHFNLFKLGLYLKSKLLRQSNTSMPLNFNLALHIFTDTVLLKKEKKKENECDECEYFIGTVLYTLGFIYFEVVMPLTVQIASVF